MSEEFSANNKFDRKTPVLNRDWGVISATFWLVAAYFGSQFIAEAFVPLVATLYISRDSKLFILQAISELAIVSVIVGIIKLYGANLRSIGLGKKLVRNDVVLALLSLPVYALVSSLFIGLLSDLLPKGVLDNTQQIGYRSSSSIAEMLLVFIALVLIPPIVEETIFRGFLFKAYRRRLGYVLGTVLVSLLFALAHLNVVVGADVFVLSLFLCYLREKTDSLWSPMLLHIAKNLVAFVLLFLISK